MREPGNTTKGEFEEADLIGEGELDVDGFIQSMEDDGDESDAAKRARAGWQRVDDWRDARWLREQLTDWDDWKDDED